MAQPNTGMADPFALINAFDRFVAGGSGGGLLVLSVSNIRGRFFEVPITVFFPEPGPKSRAKALISATADLDDRDLEEVTLVCAVQKGPGKTES